MAIKLGKYYLTRNNPRYLLRRIAELESQQKEFIAYLENEIQSCELTCDLIFNHNKEMKIYKIILLKYKEIIGGKE